MTFLRFLLRRAGAASLVMTLVAVLAACSAPADSGSGAASGDNTGGGTVAVVDGNVDLTANNLVFDASTIEAPAGEAFTITFTNLEVQPHNVAVLTEEGGDEIVRGEVIQGPDETTTVSVPALDPGEYFFLCDVHPQMNGTVVVEG